MIEMAHRERDMSQPLSVFLGGGTAHQCVDREADSAQRISKLVRDARGDASERFKTFLPLETTVPVREFTLEADDLLPQQVVSKTWRRRLLG